MKNEKIYSRNSFRILDVIQKIIGKSFLGNSKDPKKSKKRRRFAKIVIILLIAFSFAYFVLQAINPVIEAQCRSMAKSIATKISNDESTVVLSKYEYDDFLNITKDEKGNVKMVTTNMVTVNEIMSDVPNRIQEQMEQANNNTFSIRLGTFLGSKLFFGIGPNVNIKMEITGDLETDLKSEFVEAGINQTLHKIYLEVKCHVIILTPFETMQEDVISQVLIAQGIIVGEVPSSYYHLEGLDTKDTLQVIK